jgi:hypothetical protein
MDFTFTKRAIDHNTNYDEDERVRFVSAHSNKQEEDIQKSRRHRSVNRRTTGMLYLIIGIIVAYGLIATYFSVSAWRVIQHNNLLVPIYREFEMATDVYFGFPLYYEIAYGAANLFLANSTVQSSYMEIIGPIRASINANQNEFVNFIQNLDSYLTNPDLTSTYTSSVVNLRSNNLCSYPPAGTFTNQELLQCESAMRSVSGLGLVPSISNCYSYMDLSMASLQNAGYTNNETLELVQVDEFQGIDTLRQYIQVVVTEYVELVRSNIESTLSN